MAAIISVGAGINQLPLIAAIKAQGFKVAAFDGNPLAPAAELCDFFMPISTWEPGAACRWLASLDIEYCGVGCFSTGNANITRNAIANFFSLPCALPDGMVEKIQNKSLLRALLVEQGLSRLDERLCATIDDVGNLDGSRYILKPWAGVGSRGIFKVGNIDDIRRIESEIQYPFLLQTELALEEYRAQVVVSHFEIKAVNVLRKYNLDDGFITARLVVQPYDGDKVQWLASIMQALGLSDGILKIDFFYRNREAEIIEIDVGIGGDYFETHIAPMCCGYDMAADYVALITGQALGGRDVTARFKCFDYIYGLEGSVVDYRKMRGLLDDILGEHHLIEIKADGYRQKKPESNLDALFAVLHNRIDLDNALLNRRLS